MAELKDSGSRREFESGARRDIADGKGRCDLLPLDVINEIMTLFVLKDIPKHILTNIESFKKTKDPSHLITALQYFINWWYNGDIIQALLELSIHYEDGGRKYGDNNWKLGIPLHCYIDSAVRHYMKLIREEKDEPHDRAFMWNLIGALWTLEHMPALDDIEQDIASKASPLN